MKRVLCLLAPVVAAAACSGQVGMKLTPAPTPPPVGRALTDVPVYELLSAAPIGSPAPAPSSGTQVVPQVDGQSVTSLSTTPSARLQVLDAAVRSASGLHWRIEVQVKDNPDMLIASRTGHPLRIVVGGKSEAIGSTLNNSGQITGYFISFGADKADAVAAAHAWTTSVFVDPR